MSADRVESAILALSDQVTIRESSCRPEERGNDQVGIGPSVRALVGTKEMTTQGWHGQLNALDLLGLAQGRPAPLQRNVLRDGTSEELAAPTSRRPTFDVPTVYPKHRHRGCRGIFAVSGGARSGQP